ncbi:MAG: patatin-like phospholipase family protein [Microscillaceae bacterium]|jgi:patatin-like phospholipase/acyl hydrolase|nr:patatin-like phospholipase family protein [Microscillaceae bacterium]
MLKVLSIDGGGIRGIIPAIFLTELEYRTKKPIHQLFNIMAGTSTGGILTLGLNKPHPQDPTQAQYKAEDLVQLYRREGQIIFPPSVWGRTGFNMFADEKYPVRGIVSVLEKYFGNALLSESLIETIITAYEIHNRDTWIFKRRRARREKRYDFKMKYVARATSAAPTYFEPARIVPEESQDIYYMIDGGLYANNPAMVAYIDVIKNYTNLAEDKCFMLSLGTGEIVKPIPYKQAKKWGLLGWAKPTIDILFSGTSHAIHNQLNIIFDTRKPNYQYHRFEVRLDEAYSDMDKASDKYLDYYTSVTKRMIIERSREIDEVCKILTA